MVENLAKKEERIAVILEKHTKKLTYAEWILAERLKHNETIAAPEPEEPAETDGVIARPISAAELSSRLASAPKEEEVWATDCAVCLGEFEQDESVRELPCEHIFHDACIHDWFMKAKAAACPLCRNQLHSGMSNDNIESGLAPAALATEPPPLPRPTEVV